MPRRGENIYKRKDGRWEGRYVKYHDCTGKSHYGSVYAASYQAAKIKLHQAKVQLQEKPHDVCVITERLFGEVMDGWLSYNSINVKESTKQRYRYVVEHYLRPVLGAKPTKTVTTLAIEEFIHSLLCGEQNLSKKTANDILTIVKTIIKYGKLRGYQIPCEIGGLRIKVVQKETAVINKEDQKILTNWLMTDTDLRKFGVLLSLYTGLRIGELCALKWKNFCFESGLLCIRGTMQRIPCREQMQGEKTKIIVDDPKSTRSVRDIPLPKFLIEYAREFCGVPEAYVLTGQKDKFIEPRTMQYCFKRYLEQCEISPVGYHALRHTFATRCIELGFEVKSLSEILGHANVNITLNRYVHSSVALKRENMDRLCSIL